MKKEKTIRECLDNFEQHYRKGHYNDDIEKARIEGMISSLKYVLNEEE